MEKEFVLYQQSLDLKELGFNEPCLTWWNKEEFVSPYWERELGYTYESGFSKDCVLSPLYQQSFRWFREKYDLFGVVEGKGYDHKKYYIYSINGKWHPSQTGFDKPEEAELECLKKLIEIVKNK